RRDRCPHPRWPTVAEDGGALTAARAHAPGRDHRSVITSRSVSTLMLLPYFFAGCASTAMTAQWAQERVDTAEVEMKLCKESIGLAAAPTPTTTALYDRTTRPVAQDPAQLRIKTMCARQLRELLDAQRALRELSR